MSRERVVDAFLFNNELDLLELRLGALDAVVDRFVLVESTVAFSGRPKPLHFADQRERFAAWTDRITHVVVDDTPDTGGDRWGRERFQRDGILRGLGGCRCDDLVLISDVDEIPDPDTVAVRTHGGYHQLYFQYYLNCLKPSEYWVGTCALYHFEVAAWGPQGVRDRRFALPRVERGGWHFAYAMGAEAFREKLASFSHAEYDAPEHAAAFASRRAALSDVFAADAGRHVVLDVEGAYFPSHLKQRRDRYAHLLRAPSREPVAVAAAGSEGARAEAPASPPTAAVLYAYYETPEAAANLEFFAEVGMQPHPGVMHVVVINGGTCSVPLPERDDLLVLRRENVGFDFGAHAAGLASLAGRYGTAVEALPFDHFVFMNAHAVGPFLPPCFPRDRHWTTVLTSRLDARVKLVGPSIVALPPHDAGGWGPRVEGYCFATDRVGLGLVIRKGSVFADHPTKLEAIVNGEYGLSRAILDAGYTLDCLLYRYQGVDWTDRGNWGLNENRHPSRAGTYDGISIHPFEAVLHRWYWQDNPDRPVAREYVDAYRRWELQRVRRLRAGAGGG